MTAKTYRILVLESDPQYSRVIQANLKEVFQCAVVKCEVVPALCVEAARLALRAGRFDLITVDCRLQDQPDGTMNSKAGNAFIDELEKIGHTGRTVLSSSEDGEIIKTYGKMVSGKLVRTLSKGNTSESVRHFAHCCRRLVTEFT